MLECLLCVWLKRFFVTDHITHPGCWFELERSFFVLLSLYSFFLHYGLCDAITDAALHFWICLYRDSFISYFSPAAQKFWHFYPLWHTNTNIEKDSFLSRYRKHLDYGQVERRWDYFPIYFSVSGWQRLIFTARCFVLGCELNRNPGNPSGPHFAPSLGGIVHLRSPRAFGTMAL